MPVPTQCCVFTLWLTQNWRPKMLPSIGNTLFRADFAIGSTLLRTQMVIARSRKGDYSLWTVIICRLAFCSPKFATQKTFTTWGIASERADFAIGVTLRKQTVGPPPPTSRMEGIFLPPLKLRVLVGLSPFVLSIFGVGLPRAPRTMLARGGCGPLRVSLTPAVLSAASRPTLSQGVRGRDRRRHARWAPCVASPAPKTTESETPVFVLFFSRSAASPVKSPE